MKTRAHSTARRVAVCAALLLSAACASGRPAAAPAPAPEPEEVWSEPAVEPAPDAPGRDILGSAVYDLPVEANSWVEAELDFLVGERSEVIARWLERGDFYEPYIKQVLRAHEIPTDLYHLAMIESGFVPTARSHAGAVGMWQFMPATGRAMGLRVDPEIDERMDPVRSTRAAARHLRSLHRSLGDWALAAAAYNAGSGRITRGLAAFGASNFWELAHRGDLAEETRRYVPRLFAVTVIGRDRSRFGFPPAEISEQFVYDSVNVEYATPLAELARLGDVAEDRLRRLNPHLLKGITPGGGYWVWVPAGEGAELQRAWLASDFRRDLGLGTYTVRPGDNLGMLAERSGLSAARIREMNPAVRFDPLHVGVELKLPQPAARSLAARPRPAPAPAARAEAPAQARAELPAQARPDAPAEAPAQARMEAPAEVPSPAESEGAAPEGAAPAAAAVEAPARPPAESRVRARAASPASPGERVAPARTHRVEPGETLWSISRAYGVTVASIERANGLEGTTIRPGQSLSIPAAADAPETGVPTTALAPVAPTPASAARPSPERSHVVATGETLWSIARRYGSSVEMIREANALGDRPIQPGQRLVIPEPEGGGP